MLGKPEGLITPNYKRAISQSSAASKNVQQTAPQTSNAGPIYA
jgi:hypothetical protein